VCVCSSVCVCVRERARERESVCVYVCTCVLLHVINMRVDQASVRSIRFDKYVKNKNARMSI
jgi:hypothetical protein